MKLKQLKLTQYQRKYVRLFDNYTAHNPLSLLIFLFKLKVINMAQFIECKDKMIDTVNTWKYAEHTYKATKYRDHESRNYPKNPPKSIKPTKARF